MLSYQCIIYKLIYNTDVVVNTCKPSTREAKQKELEFQGSPGNISFQNKT